MTIMSTIFWDVKMCGPIEVHQCVLGMYYFYLQGRKVSEALCQQESVSCLAYLDSR
jgi:hypothetical protein